MTYRLSDFEGLAGLKVVRDGPFEVTAKLSTPLRDMLVPVRAEAYVAEVNASDRVAAVLTTPELASLIDPRFGVAVAENPLVAHAEVHNRCALTRQAELAGQPTVIDPSARIDGSASVAGYGVTIGANVIIGPKAVVLPGVSIEQDCVIHPGVVLGVEGFQVGKIGGRQRIVPQLGGVRLKPGVEILANSCVARALFGGETTIGEETVTDNLVYIAHDCQIGARVQICALVNILGRVEIGDGAYIGPSAVVLNGAKIGAGAKVSIGAVVTRDVAAGQTVSGNFAIDHDRFLDHVRSIR